MVPDEVADVDRESSTAGRPPSERVPAQPEAGSSAAAIAFIDESGLPSLTMRRLGERARVWRPCRCTATSRAVRTCSTGWWRASSTRCTTTPTSSTSPRDGWQDFLQRLAHGVRRVALAHPKVFPLVASRPAGGAVAAAAAAQPSLGGDLPRRPHSRGLQRRRGASSPTAPSPASCSVTCCWRSPPSGRTSVRSTSSTTPRTATTRRMAPLPDRAAGCAGALAEDHAAAEFEEALEGAARPIARTPRVPDRARALDSPGVVAHGGQGPGFLLRRRYPRGASDGSPLLRPGPAVYVVSLRDLASPQARLRGGRPDLGEPHEDQVKLPTRADNLVGFLPNLIGFLLLLLVGYVVAKVVATVVRKVLDRRPRRAPALLGREQVRRQGSPGASPPAASAGWCSG